MPGARLDARTPKDYVQRDATRFIAELLTEGVINISLLPLPGTIMNNINIIITIVRILPLYDLVFERWRNRIVQSIMVIVDL